MLTNITVHVHVVYSDYYFRHHVLLGRLMFSAALTF